jgi:hypothetical protein
MSYDLSYLMPGIRPQNWIAVYDSLKRATKRSCEIVFVGPYAGPDELMGLPNVKFIEDWGSPVRAAQIALTHSEGKFVFLGCDDGYFFDGALDHLFDELESMGEPSPYNIVIGKYTEGSGSGMADDWYYYITKHASHPEGVKDDWFMGNNLLLDREHFIETFGGYNTKFEGNALCNNELAVRIQITGKYKIKLSKNQVMRCDHTPGESGDHAPMHHAQLLHDQPLYMDLIPKITANDIKVNFEGWIDAPAVWKRRFNYVPTHNYFRVKKYDREIWECIYDS